MAAVPLAAAQRVTSPSPNRFRYVAASTVMVLVGAPSLAYYLKVVRPRWQYQHHLAALRATPRPHRRTKLFVGGEEPMKSTERAAMAANVDLAHSSGTSLFGALVPFYAHVVWRMILLVARTVPVLIRYAAARYGLLGASYRSAHESLRDLLVAMGPSFIKLGQWAATRPDVFPVELCQALSSLFDGAPPHPWEATQKALEVSGIAGKVRDVSEKPLNSGSIAQVHRAVLAEDYVIRLSETDPGTLAALFGQASSTGRAVATGDQADEVVLCKAGTPVVLKVMHPGVREQILADSVALVAMGRFLAWIIPRSQFLSLEQTAEEVCGLAVSQLDMLREADNLIEFRFNFRALQGEAARSTVVFPTPLVNLSSKDVLVETFEVGEPLNESNSKEYASLGKVAIDMFMKMLFEDNLVHADLHPGNLLFRMINPDGSPSIARTALRGSKPQIVVLDPGLVTSLSEKERKNFISLFAAVASGDGDMGAQLMYDNAPGKQECTDVEKFKSDMREIFDTINPKKLGSFALGDVSIGEKLTHVMDVMRDNKVRIDMNFATLVSTVLVGEGMGKRLEPDFNLIEHALPFLVKCLRSNEMDMLVSKLQETFLTVAL
jgi:aarF domain-containing kinase